MDKIFVFSIFVARSFAAILQLNESEYARLPPLVHIEPYEACLQQQGAVYCDAFIHLVAAEPSPLLQFIQEYSSFESKHFNHSILHHGVCVTETCKEFIEEPRTDLKLTLEACFNKTMWERYKLKSKVSDNYSCNVHEKKLRRGLGDTIVAVVCILVVVVNVIASVYEYCNPEEKTNKVIGALLCFSIMRNWRKLTAPLSEKSDPRLKQLQSIHGFRAMTMCLVIMVHSTLPCYIFVQNPQYIEEMYEEVHYQLVFNGTVIMQTFLIMSGFLLVYNSLLYEETKEVTWMMVPKLIARRWLRLTPPYALVLGLTSTWLRYVSNGPFWQMAAGREAADCRQHWWRHLLYINNYYDNSLCMQQTWYLGVDMQLFSVGVLLYVICKRVRVRRLLLPTLCVIGALIPGLHTYYQDLDANMLLTPETVLAAFTNSPIFNHIYKKGHTNLPGYIIGLSLGYIFYNWQKTGVKGESYYKYRHVYRALWLVGTGVVYSGSIFYEDRPRDPMYVRVLYSILVKPVFALLMAGTIAGTMLGIEISGFYRSILEWKFWTYMSRLSFSAYLWHIAYIRTTTASLKQTMHVDFLAALQFSLSTLVASYLIALVFWMLVEAPLGNILKNAPSPNGYHRKVQGLTGENNSSSAKKNKEE